MKVVFELNNSIKNFKMGCFCFLMEMLSLVQTQTQRFGFIYLRELGFNYDLIKPDLITASLHAIYQKWDLFLRAGIAELQRTAAYVLTL